MYETYFGLSRPPFSTTPDPAMLYLTHRHREVLAGLTYAVMCRKGFVLLAGEAGTGKTTVIRRLIKVTSSMQVRLSVVFNPTVTAAEFLELVLLNFGVTSIPVSKAQRLAMLEQILTTASNAHHNCVLIIDEAHKLSPDLLEEIRLLSNFETDDQKLLQIVLAGQPEIDHILNDPRLWQLKQRIAMRVQTSPLTPSDISAYLAFRWREAHSLQPLPFTKDAVAMVALWSGGIPRLINIICDNALLLTMAAGMHTVETSHVTDAVRDLNLEHTRRAPATVAPETGTEPMHSGSTATTRVANQLNGHPSKTDATTRVIEKEPGRMFERVMPEPRRSLLDRWAARFRS